MTSVRAPMCMGCKHLRDAGDGLTCDAFPEGIPQPIYMSQVDHRKPYEGDQGILFDPKNEGASAYASELMDDAEFMFNPAQPRGYHGKWVETGAEEARKAEAESKRLVDKTQEKVVHAPSHVQGRPTADYVCPDLVDTVEAYNNSEQAIAEWAGDHAMTVPEYKVAAQKHIEGLLKKAKLARRFSAENLPKVLESGRFKNTFEKGIIGGMNTNEVYTELERDLWGYPEKMSDNKLRPIFGYLTDDPDGEIAEDSELANYGDATVVFKDTLRPRTTYSFHDSAGVIASGMEMGLPEAMVAPINEPNINTYAHADIDILKVEHVQDARYSAHSYKFEYAEAQYHEGVSIDDVDYFVLPDEPADEIKQQLIQSGKKWKVAGQRYANMSAYDQPDEAIAIVPFFRGSEAIVEAPVTFYRPDQRRDRGRFADEGRGRRPGTGDAIRKESAKSAEGVQTYKDAVQKQHGSTGTAVRAPGGPTPGVDPKDEAALREQVVRCTIARTCSAFDTACMKREAEKQGFSALADYLDKTTPANWFSLLTDVAPDVQAMMGGEDMPLVEVNLGVTPYRGKPIESVAGTEGYYTSERYKGWLQDVRAEAARTGVEIQDVVKVSGVWLGKTEPSASVWVKGTPEGVRKLANSLGAEYNQGGVMMFTGEDDGQGALYTMPGMKEKDRDSAVQAMQQHGVMGGRVIKERNGEYALEVADSDGSLYDGVMALSKELGLEVYGTPGKVTFLEAGTDYQRRSQPHKGSGMTHRAHAQDLLKKGMTRGLPKQRSAQSVFSGRYY